jgi:flagellar hook-length control protein FliK
MNTMNELLQMQLTSAAQAQQTVKTDTSRKAGNDGDSSFKQLLKDRVGSDGTKTNSAQKKTGSDVKKDAAEDPKDETLKEVAVAMTMLMSQAAPAQIQTQEILPDETQNQSTAPVELLTGQQLNGQAALQSGELAGQSGALPLAGELGVSGQQRASDLQTAQNTDIMQATQLTKTPQEVTVTVQPSGTQSHGSTDEQPDNTNLTRQDDDRGNVQMESVDAGTAQPLFRDTQTVPVKVGETPVADTTQPDLDDRLAKQIGTTLEEGTQQVKLQLTPESLGTLTIDLTRTQDGALQVVLHTTTEKAANLLNQHAENLSALLQNSTQNTVQIEVQRQDQNQQFQQQFQQQNQQHGNSQQHSRRQQSGEDFLQQLRLGLVTLDEQVS